MNARSRASLLPILALLALVPLSTSCGAMGYNLATMSSDTTTKSFEYKTHTEPKKSNIYKKTKDGAEYLGTHTTTQTTDLSVVKPSKSFDAFLGAGTILDIGLLSGSLYATSEAQSDAGTIAGGVGVAIGLAALFLDASFYYAKSKDMPAPGARPEDSFFIRSSNGTWYEAKPSAEDIIDGKVTFKIEDLEKTKEPEDIKGGPSKSEAPPKESTTPKK